MNSRARTDVDDNRRRRRDRHRPAHAALRAGGARRGGSGSASCERPLVLALAPPDLSGANARVDARPSMKDEALPHRVERWRAPRTRCGCCGWSCFGPSELFPNMLATAGRGRPGHRTVESPAIPGDLHGGIPVATGPGLPYKQEVTGSSPVPPIGEMPARSDVFALEGRAQGVPDSGMEACWKPLRAQGAWPSSRGRFR